MLEKGKRLAKGKGNENLTSVKVTRKQTINVGLNKAKKKAAEEIDR